MSRATAGPRSARNPRAAIWEKLLVATRRITSPSEPAAPSVTAAGTLFWSGGHASKVTLVFPPRALNFSTILGQYSPSAPAVDPCNRISATVAALVGTGVAAGAVVGATAGAVVGAAFAAAVGATGAAGGASPPQAASRAEPATPMPPKASLPNQARLVVPGLAP